MGFMLSETEVVMPELEVCSSEAPSCLSRSDSTEKVISFHYESFTLIMLQFLRIFWTCLFELESLQFNLSLWQGFETQSTWHKFLF